MQNQKDESLMIAYLLVLLAVLSRYLVVGHVSLMNFTAVTGGLLYFGARRSWREMAGPLAILMVSDYCLTTYAYHYAFHWQGYLPIWIWYLAAMVLGQILLQAKTSWVRVAAGAILGPTAFWLYSNFAVWIGGGMYPPTRDGLWACYVAAIPFYRNDLAATSIVLAAAFGIPVLVKLMHPAEPAAARVRR
ncbi:MAG TPA: DUF6580 family putative transport protein [Terracidiphilus sp.]|nr:DUF6580 family putative transport protein [Terracidiphilus sp.]